MPDLTQSGYCRHGAGASLFQGFTFFLAMAALASPASADFKGGEWALGMLDYARALAEFRSALADGDLRALFEIGLIHERGHGVSADAAKAARWYRKAVREAGDPVDRRIGGGSERHDWPRILRTRRGAGLGLPQRRAPGSLTRETGISRAFH